MEKTIFALKMPQKYLHRYLNISYVTTHLCLILVVFVRFLLLPRGIFVRVVHRLLVSVVNEVALVGVIVLFGSRFAGRGFLYQIKQINQSYSLFSPYRFPYRIG